MPAPHTRKTARLLLPALLLTGALAACSDQQPLGGSPETAALRPSTLIQAYDCTGTLTGRVSCSPTGARTGAVSPIIIGGQNTYVKLTSSNLSYDSISEIYQFDVTVKNLLNEVIGSPDGVTPDPEGIRVFFHSGPTVTGGTGVADVYNPDGYDAFTAGNQPYFAYPEILEKNEVSAAKTWQLLVPRTATSFVFQVYVETDVQYLLVINEVLANPGGTITDANGEWFEIYNAGTLSVDLQNLLIADSSASGRRPYHVIASSVVVAPGGYAVLGTNADTIGNGGVPVDYAYGYSALALANSLDAVKISRAYGSDTLTVDRTAYTSAAISAKNGVSRELKNPSLNNDNTDASNWGDAAITAAYGPLYHSNPANRGTPKAQNSAYVP